MIRLCAAYVNVPSLVRSNVSRLSSSRYYLYIWLDKEVEALRNLCGYRSSYVPSDSGDGTDSDGEHPVEKMAEHYLINNNNNHENSSSHLHELILAEKLDLEAKMLRLGRRKRWLTSHAPFLRTLLSYCSLHGADGGGLASVRMELILLLQELQQEKPSNKLLSTPLPFPTTLPLLSASVAASKTVPSSGKRLGVKIRGSKQRARWTWSGLNLIFWRLPFLQIRFATWKI